jgi:hypothetical protein
VLRGAGEVGYDGGMAEIDETGEAVAVEVEVVDERAGRPRGAGILNHRQLAFARFVAEGNKLRDAYRRAYGVAKGSKGSALAKQPQVAAEIARRQQEAEAACTLKRDEALRFLTAVIRTPVAELHATHDLVQEIATGRDGSVKVRGMSKLAAMKMLGQMTGWFKPKEEEEEGERKTIFYIKNMWEDGPPKLVEGQDLGDH